MPLLSFESHAEVETLRVTFLDAHGRRLAEDVMSDGLRGRATVPLRQIVTRAITLEAAAVSLAHNHPSGRAEPSPADCALTRTLVAVLRPIGIVVWDHLIQGGPETFSFRRAGLL